MPELQNDVLTQLLDAAHELELAELPSLASAVHEAREAYLWLTLKKQELLAAGLGAATVPNALSPIETTVKA